MANLALLENLANGRLRREHMVFPLLQYLIHSLTLQVTVDNLLKQWLLTPFPNIQSAEEKNYNVWRSLNRSAKLLERVLCCIMWLYPLTLMVVWALTPIPRHLSQMLLPCASIWIQNISCKNKKVWKHNTTYSVNVSLYNLYNTFLFPLTPWQPRWWSRLCSFASVGLHLWEHGWRGRVHSAAEPPTPLEYAATKK